MPPSQDNDRLIAVLRAHDVQFVLIGGLAAILQGSPYPTEDLDITPKRERENLQRLSEALAELDAHVYTASEPDGLPFGHSAESLADSGVWNLVTSAGRLDISFVPNGTDGYPDLHRDALNVEINGVAIEVANLADIIRSKEAADRDKDRRVLPTLRKLLAARRSQET